MNKGKRILAAAMLLTSGSVYAELSSTLTLTSDNVSRGISDTDGAPAIQGSFDYAHDSGAYAGLWASNVKFRENANAAAIDTVEEATIEIDYYLGYSSDLSDAMSWDAGVAYMSYPDADSSLNYDYWEAYAMLAYTLDEVMLSPEFGIELYHTSENTGNTGTANYYVASLAFMLPMDVSLSLAAGRSTFDDFPADDYTDYRIGFSKEIEGLTFELFYSDSSLSQATCGGEMCDSRVVFAVSRSL